MSARTRILRIGIASREQMRERTLAVARGGRRPAADEPKVWFTSLESLSQVLSSKNRLLLEIIRRSRPASVRQLAELSGRKESNLSRTLRTMERYRLVRLDKSEHGRLVPSVPYDRVELDYKLDMESISPPRRRSAQNERRNPAG
jgi:predicted transcriptional regulator